MKTIRPFFTFYGGKYRAAPRYPKPKHSRIIEPFAGSAGYSMRYPDLNVTLVDADPVIAGVWDFLIRSTSTEIRALPLMSAGQHVDELAVCQEARWFIGFCLNKGRSAPSKTMSAWGCEPRYSQQFWGETIRERAASQVDRIKHWQIIHGDYTAAPDVEATWFIDPPYQVMGKHYVHRLVDYEALATWSRSRRGQVTVCENEGATWLPFRPFLTLKANESRTGGKRSKEAIWQNRSTLDGGR